MSAHPRDHETLRRESDAHPVWMTYPPAVDSVDGSPKQRALLDAISAISWDTNGPPDCSTTEDLAAAVGCDVESAWHALIGTGFAVAYLSSFLLDTEDIHQKDRGAVLWGLPEDPYTDDADWYRFRIDESKRLGQPESAEHWRRESLSDVERAEEDRKREVDRVAAEHAARQCSLFEREGGGS